MTDGTGDPLDTAGTARRALHAYRERRRRRRAPDTWFGRAEGLAWDEAALDAAELGRRRDELLAEARAAGIPAELADAAYDVAREEGVDPALALELVRAGVGVAPPPGGVSSAPDAPALDRYRPEWLLDPVPPDDLLRERMLRVSFRRLRALLERHGDAEAALDALAAEPDAGVHGY